MRRLLARLGLRSYVWIQNCGEGHHAKLARVIGPDPFGRVFCIWNPLLPIVDRILPRGIVAYELSDGSLVPAPNRRWVEREHNKKHVVFNKGV